jgi:hypothetical protein
LKIRLITEDGRSASFSGELDAAPIELEFGEAIVPEPSEPKQQPVVMPQPVKPVVPSRPEPKYKSPYD